MSDAADLTAELFSPGDRWSADTQAGPVALSVESVVPLGHGQRPGGAFTIMFFGPCEPILPQAIYRLSRGDDSHEIFIVPVANDAVRTYYEAVFT